MNQNEKRGREDQNSSMVVILQQTILNKVELLEQKFNASSAEALDKIEEQLNSIIQQVDSNQNVFISKIEGLNILELKHKLNDEFEEALFSLEKIKRNLYLYIASVIVFVLFIFASTYAIKYYSIRGNHAKYEYVKKKGGVKASRYFLEIDSLYDQTSYTNFKIKYDLDY